MFQISFKIANYSNVIIYTNIKEVKDLILNERTKIFKTIPITDFKVFNLNNLDTIDENALIITKGNNKQLKYNKEKNIAKMYINDNIRLFDITYVLLEMFENSLIRNKKYLVHSSALKYDDDKAILLLGDANAGKSSLAYSLMNDYGMKLVSNDHTLIGFEDKKLKTYAGTKLLEMRNGVILEKFPKLLDKIDIEKDNDIWKKKIIINDYIDENLLSKNDKAHVTDVFQINLTNGGNAFLQTKDYYDQRLILYQRICDELKGNYNLILGFDYPMPSLESFEILSDINNSIKDALDTTSVHIASGPIKQLTKKMVTQIEK